MGSLTTNKSLVLDALDILFNKRDFETAAERWSLDYVQHSRLVPPGRDGLFGLVRSMPEGTRYEPGLAMADGEFVMIHGRYAQPCQRALVAVDMFRINNGILVEHWDVLQEEATIEESAGGHPMFGDQFPGTE
ncbi:nuclear transport factor 2 family protein [Neorhizobium sp. LMR1-1-1.1]